MGTENKFKQRYAAGRDEVHNWKTRVAKKPWRSEGHVGAQGSRPAPLLTSPPTPLPFHSPSSIFHTVVYAVLRNLEFGEHADQAQEWTGAVVHC